MFRDYPEFNNHQMVIALTDEAAGLKGYIAVHSTRRGPAQGGTRMQAYDSDEAAIRDALNLSCAMSYKCALADLPYGGGKGVIVVNKDTDHDRALAAYTRLVDQLGGLFKTGTDVGVTDQDVVRMAKITPHMMGVTKADRGDLTTSKAAAQGVFAAMQVVLTKLYGSDDFKGRKIAIKGVGKLGGELARLVHAAGATVYIADTNAERCQSLKAELNDVIEVPTSKIHIQTVDIYAPCALGNEFSTVVIEGLGCHAIVGGANNQLPDSDAGDKLFQKKILYAPDYVVNAGGLMYVVDELEKDGFDKQRVIKRIQGIKDTLGVIFKRSAQENTPTHRIADTIAQERIQNT